MLQQIYKNDVVCARMDESTAQTLVRVHAVLLWVVAVFLLIMAAAFSFFFPTMMMNAMQDPEFAADFVDVPVEQFNKMNAVMPLIGAFVLFPLSLLTMIAGIGLWLQRRWGRILALILSVLLLFSFPFGTVIGIFGIWVLGFNADVQQLFSNTQAQKTTKHKKKR